ncbi:MAG TPA: ABC transporter permease [Thermodesulfovibrionales bacterium]|nr:ABC transporter permease [Thermodesulfovibrionales bacterium]
MGKAGKISIALLSFISLLCFTAPLICPHNPDTINLDSIKEPPSLHHLLGTDNKGRDILSRVLHGGRISIGVAFVAALLSMGIGLIVGLVSGYAGGKIDIAFMAFIDLILSFPAFLLAIGISVVLPPGIFTVMVAIAAVGWASFARLIRGYILTVKEAAFVESAKAVGCSRMRILFVHLMPQCVPLIFVMMGIKLGGYILTEASLSFLGLGAQPPTATWGAMVSANRAYISSAPWMVFFPGLMIAITSLCFNMMGDALRDRYALKIE